jgi:hypothetical protein
MWRSGRLSRYMTNNYTVAFSQARDIFLEDWFCRASQLMLSPSPLPMSVRGNVSYSVILISTTGGACPGRQMTLSLN